MKKSASQLTMGAVAKRRGLCHLAGAHGRLASGIGFENLRREAGPAVGAVAPRLVVRLAARTPRVRLAGFEVFHLWGVARWDWLFHRQSVYFNYNNSKWMFTVNSSKITLSPRLSKNESEP